MMKKVISLGLGVLTLLAATSSASVLQDKASGKYVKAHSNLTVSLVDRKADATNFIVTMLRLPTGEMAAGVARYTFEVGGDELASRIGACGPCVMLFLACNSARQLSMTMASQSPDSVWTGSVTPDGYCEPSLHGVTVVIDNPSETVVSLDWLKQNR
jgi:hypothetical protein